MKRMFIFSAAVLAVLLIMSGAAGCRRNTHKRDEGKITVTSLIFPSYDFARAIAGDRVNLIMLLPPGADSHSFEISPRDIITIRESDIFIYPGGETFRWVDRILDSAEISKRKTKVIKLLDLVDALEDTLVEGMERHEHHHHEHDHDCDHDHDYECDHDYDCDHDHSHDVPILDEHIWTPPGNARIIAAAITEALCDLDGANAEFYRENAADYFRQLDELDAVFRSIVDGAKRKTIVFGDRFPFRYFADAYGLEYFAAFPSCAAEAEPSAATVGFLINKVKSENIPVVFHMELSNEKVADIISEATGAKKRLLHSAHNVTKREFDSGANYIDLQKANAVNLQEALW